MKIKSLDISGFKSFCDRTKVKFDNSVTAVVGPNGCGKSNIVDAIRWGLGEQSVKTLRGKGMGDVIFGGSEKRGPQSRAEVTITFDNSDGLSHPLYTDYPEVAVTRKLHRDGTSEYLINKTPCRLKDISDLFAGTGGGARAYSIIEQGRIGLIVSSRSEDRRGMIEEAAGITRFKKSRQAAIKKMEMTRQNLLRISDVVKEMGRNMENLKRQARKAERYNLYAKEQRDNELYVAAHRYLEHLAKLKTQNLLFEASKAEFDNFRDDQELAEARLETLRIDEATSRTELESAKQIAAKADTEITMLETEIGHLEKSLERIQKEEGALQEQQLETARRLQSSKDEREVIEARLGSLDDDAEYLTNIRLEAERRAENSRERLLELGRNFDEKRDNMSRYSAKIAASQAELLSMNRRVEDLEERLKHIIGERDTLCGQIEEFSKIAANMDERFISTKEELESLRVLAKTEGEAYEELLNQVKKCDDEKALIKEALGIKSTRLESLKEMNESLERNGNAVREAAKALNEEGTEGFSGLLVDYIECPQKYEIPLAAVLSEKLESLVVNSFNEGLHILDWLKSKELGRVTALSMTGITDDGSSLAGEFNHELVLGSLAGFIKISSEISTSLNRVLKDIYVVENIDSIRVLKEQTAGVAGFVTLDGQFFDKNGTLQGGCAKSAGADLLGQSREIRELEQEVTSLRTSLNDVDFKFENLKDEMNRRGDAAEKARVDLQRTGFVLSEIEKDQSRAKRDLESVKERNSNLDRDITQLNTQLEQTVTQQTAMTADLEKYESEKQNLLRVIEDESQLISAVREEADRLQAEVTDAKIKEAQFIQQQHSAVERAKQIAAIEHDAEKTKERISFRKSEIAVEVKEITERILILKEKLDASLDSIDTLAKDVQAKAVVLDEKMAIFNESQQLFKEKRQFTENLRANVSKLELAVSKVESDIEHIIESAIEKYDVELTLILGEYHMRPMPGIETFNRIEELKGLIERMGSINPTAIDEYSEIQERFVEKESQKDDIEQALEDLETAIAKMDKDSRRMFKETFDVVNEKFQEIFPRLFMGGHARLELTDPDDLLNTGVDIIASPPGKKLRAIELMSGGEKALTAVSLLFAIFMQRPSPFCLLDEVDAPLDDANVGRFIDMVKEMTDKSQFVIITHSKITMEGSDSLYGVTMQEPGVSKMISVNLVNSRTKSTNNSKESSSAAV